MIKRQFLISIEELKDKSACSIRNEDIEFLKKLLGEKKISVTRYYSGSRNGWMPKDFHSWCDNKGPTISFF